MFAKGHRWAAIPNSPACREKLSIAGRGRTVSEESREKRRQKMKGRPVSEAQKEAIRATKTGLLATEEHKASLRAAWVIRRARAKAKESIH